MMRSLLLALLLVPVLAEAQSGRDSVVSVNLTRSIRVPPDRALFYVMLEGTAETAADALARVDGKIGSVVRALRAFGRGVEVGEPMSISLGPTNSMRGYPGQPSLGTVTARSAIRVRVTQLDLLTRVMMTATDSGAAGVAPPTYESSALDSLRRVEVAATIPVAQREAEAMARALGGRLAGLASITTNTHDVMMGQPIHLSFDGNFSQPPRAPDVQLNFTLYVSFRLAR